MAFALASLCVSFCAATPRSSWPPCSASYFESFAERTAEYAWIPSDAPNYTGAWQIEHTRAPRMAPQEAALVMKTANAHSAVSTAFQKKIHVENKTIIIQYEVRPQSGLTCSGAYLKVFSDERFLPSLLTNETRYTILFGPDRCADDAQIRFIYNHFHPVRRVYLAKALRHRIRPPLDALTHLYTLVIRPNASFSIWVDNVEKKNGSLFFDFTPPLLEPREIDDSTDVRPKNFAGKWKPRKIRNPNYFMDLQPSNFPPFTGVGFELWATNRDIAFSNLLIAHNEEALRRWNAGDFLARQRAQRESPPEFGEGAALRYGFYATLRRSLADVWAGLRRLAAASPPAGVAGAVAVGGALLLCASRGARPRKRKPQ
jgi:hypothetical protein